jgi:hypothetical protein
MGLPVPRREAAMDVSLIISGLLVVCMIGTSVYGARVLPADARVPLHYGFGSYGSYVPKTAGLILWPVAGAIVYLIFLGIDLHAIRPNHPSGSAPVILPILLAVLVLAHVGAIRKAVGATKNPA